MKILHIVPSYIPAYRYGGPIESVHNLNAALVKNGVEVTVYTTNINGLNDLDASIGAPVIKDGVKIFYFKSSFPRAWFYSRDLRKTLAQSEQQFDIFHITSTFLAASTLGAYYAKKFKKPYIISPRGNLMLSPLGKKNLKKFIYNWLIEKKNLRDADAIHFTTPVEKEEYIKGGFSLKRGIVLPNIIRLDEFVGGDNIGDFRGKFGLSDDKRIILYLGRLNWIKGLDTLISAFAEVVKKEPNAVLVLAGPDENNYISNLKSQISAWPAGRSNLKIDDKIIFTGMLTGDDKIAAYRGSDIFVLPSYSESFGMAAVEAMFCGLPVVVTKGVGISPNVEKAGAGIVIEKDKEQLSEAILKILNEPDLAKKMGQNGKQLVKNEFSCDVVAEKFISAYNEIIDKHKNL
ncbi:MAG: glycosyltransferase [Patescibacteria group bacterium]